MLLNSLIISLLKKDSFRNQYAHEAIAYKKQTLARMAMIMMGRMRGCKNRRDIVLYKATRRYTFHDVIPL